jgi:hypothetical protein
MYSYYQDMKVPPCSLVILEEVYDLENHESRNVERANQQRGPTRVGKPWGRKNNAR